MKCEKCGAEMTNYCEGHSSGSICPQCGWGIATSYFRPYETDMTNYAIEIYGNKADKTIVKIVAEISNRNFLQAKAEIEKPAAIIFTGKASEIMQKKKMLSENNILFKIIPEFPY